MWESYFVLKVHTSFNQHMSILAPYMTEMQQAELRSEWALMNNNADHEVIVKKLNDLAASKGIALKNPIY